MLDKIKTYLQHTQDVWSAVQDLASVKGGLYIDLFAFAVVVRLLAPLKGYPAMTASEAGLWASTIAAFAYSNNKPNGGA